MSTKGLLLGTVFDAPPGENNLVECTTYQGTETDWMETPQSSLGIGGIWTIAFWQRRTTPGQAAGIPLWFASTSTSGGGRIAWYQNSDTTCVIEIRDDVGLSSTFAKNYNYTNMITANADIEWEHIVLVYNANGGSDDTLLTYLNGVDITEKTTTLGIGDVRITKTQDANPNQTDIATRTFTMGAGVGGAIDIGAANIYNFGIWDVELSAAEALSLYNGGAGNEVDLRVASGSYASSADLQHYWRFDSAADRGLDLGISPLDLLDDDAGTHTFVTSECPETISDVQDMSLTYDGTFGMASPGASETSGIDASVGSSYTFSFAIWAKADTPVDAGRDALMSVRTAGGSSALDWGLDDNSNTDLTCQFVNAATSFRQFQTWSDVVTPGAWHHIVLTWDGTTGTGSDAGGPHCYVDGVNVDSGNRAAALNSDGSGFDAASDRIIKVGTQIAGTTQWEGPIFTASIYNSVLTSAEIIALYASGDAQAVDPRVDTGNYVSSGTLLHYYRLGIGQSAFQFGEDYTTLGNEIRLDGGADLTDLTTDIPS